MKKRMYAIEIGTFAAMVFLIIAGAGPFFQQTDMDPTSSWPEGVLYLRSALFFVLSFLCLICFFAIQRYYKKREQKTVLKMIFERVRPKYVVGIMGVLLVVGVFCVIYYGQNVLLYHPNNSEMSAYYLTQRKVFRPIEIEGGEHKYQGWLYKPSADRRKTIVYFGGNAESSASTVAGYDLGKMWKTFGKYNFLMIDYPGYGLSEGEITKDNLLNMARATLEFVEGEESLNKEIVVMGYSLGTGIATYVASEYEVDKLLLLAPYDKMENVYNAHVDIFHGPLKYLVRNDYDSIASAEKINLTPFIIASKADEVIPYELSVNLGKYFSNGVAFLTLETAGHGDLMYQEEVKEKIHTFLEEGK